MPKSCILFTDVKKSSYLWAMYPKQMPKALEKHTSQITKLCTKYKALIVKSIGDAFMIAIPDLKKCLDFCIELCRVQIRDPIKLGKDFLKVRIGFSYGNPLKKEVVIQNKKLIDYFGSPVNAASRMESKVSDVGGFAFVLMDEKNINKKVIDYLQKNKVDVQPIHYKKSCKDRIKRSVRLLNSQQLILCDDAAKLHGVGTLIAYKCNL